MVFLISIMEIDIDKNIMYQLIYNLMILKNIMYFYFALPPFSVNINFCYSRFDNGVNYLSLVTTISKISTNILNILKNGFQNLKFRNDVENFIINYISNSLNLVNDNDQEITTLLNLKTKNEEHEKILLEIFRKKKILFYRFIFHLFILLNGELNNKIIDSYGDFGEYIGKAITYKKVDLKVLYHNIDLLNLKKKEHLYIFIKDKILKL